MRSPVLHRVDLPNDLEPRHAVQVGTVMKKYNDALGAHTHAHHLRVVIQLLELLHFFVVPHDDFVLWPLWITASTHKSHDVLLIQELNDADPTVQIPRQQQRHRVALVDPEPCRGSHGQALLVLIESCVEDIALRTVLTHHHGGFHRAPQERVPLLLYFHH